MKQSNNPTSSNTPPSELRGQALTAKATEFLLANVELFRDQNRRSATKVFHAHGFTTVQERMAANLMDLFGIRRSYRKTGATARRKRIDTRVSELEKTVYELQSTLLELIGDNDKETLRPR